MTIQLRQDNGKAVLETTAGGYRVRVELEPEEGRALDLKDATVALTKAMGSFPQMMRHEQ